MTVDHGGRTNVVDGEVISVNGRPVGGYRRRGFTSPDWLTPELYVAVRRTWRNRALRRILGLIIVVGAIIGTDAMRTEVAETSPEYVPAAAAAPVRYTPPVEPGLAPTTGLVAVKAKDVSAKLWLDVMDWGYVGRQGDRSDRIIYVDPDALLHLAKTKADRKFARNNDDDRDGKFIAPDTGVVTYRD